MFDLLINISLIILGTICLTAGVSFFIREKNNPHFSIVMLLLSVFSFLWCTGYAWMGLAQNYSHAYIGRIIGLFGVIAFMVTESAFLYFHLIKNKIILYLFSSTLFVTSIIDYILFVSPKVIEFTTHNGRTCYYALSSPRRTFHDCLLSFLFFTLIIMAILWRKKVRVRREKQIVNAMIFANFFLLFAALPDTFLPLLNLPSFPSSCFGSVVVCLSLWFSSTRLNAFSISFQNLSSYLFKDINTSLLVFNLEGKISIINEHAKKYFDIDSSLNASLNDLFEITQKDSTTLLNDILNSKHCFEYRLKPRSKNAICSLTFNAIYDRYHDPYCITCSIYDLTKEEIALKKVEEMQQNLQKDLKTKSYEIEHLTLQAITTIANTIDAKDAYTKGHSIRVAEYSAILAQNIGWNEEEVQNLKYVALLHDIGKIGVPDNILCKPDKLTDVEFSLVKAHTNIGSDILKDISMIPHVSEGATYHHERYDGKGYPCGLAGEKIPLIARIICIADSYDAMNSKRIYRNPLSKDYIVNEFKQCSGKQFDPYLTECFVRLLEENKLVLKDEFSSGEKTLADESAALLNQIMKNLEENNRTNKNTDYLTGLLNRTSGEPLIIEAMQAVNGCLLFADLDNLKTINDRYGHLTGDHTLKSLAEILKLQIPNSIIARVGGDEFLCFIKNVSQKDAEQIALGLLHAFHSFKDNENNLSSTSLSIGLCITTTNDIYASAYQNADKALYYVKQNGKDGYYFYNRNIAKNEPSASKDLSKIVESIVKQGSYNGAFDVSYREFTKLYEYVNNLVIRYNHSIELIMITVTSISDYEHHEEAMNCMNQAICTALRNVDINTRFSNEQFLVILVNAQKENVEKIVQRIFDTFYKMYPKNNIICNYERSDVSPTDIKNIP